MHPQHNADTDAEPIGPLELNYEGISTLKKKQLPYIRYALIRDCSLFTAHIIKQHMPFAMSKTEDDDMDGGHDFDDDDDHHDDDGNGVNDVEDDPGGSTSDSDAIKEIGQFFCVRDI